MCEPRIGNIIVYPIRPTSKGLIGFGACTFADSLALNDIALYTKPDGSGIRCLYPIKKLLNGKVINIFCPLNAQIGKELEDAFNKKVKEIARRCEEDDNDRYSV